MPTKADHNRTHLFMVHSPCLVSPLCTGWRKEDHAASPRRGTALSFLPFFAVFSNRKGSLVGGNDNASRLCAADGQTSRCSCFAVSSKGPNAPRWPIPTWVWELRAFSDSTGGL